jgi:hypothetical protein
MAIATGSTVRLSGLPSDHPALGNQGVAIVQGSSAYLGQVFYYVHALSGGAIHQVPAANVTAAPGAVGPAPLPPLSAFWGRPQHHMDAP